MALSITEINNTGNESNLPKTFGPGNQKCKINSIQLVDFTYLPGGKHLILNLETEPIEGFQGFAIDKNNADLGFHAGQVGRVKAGRYAFANGKTKKGTEINRDIAFLTFLKNLCLALNCDEWFQAQNNRHETIDDFVTAFNEEAPFQDVYLDYCIAGKEYQNNAGYISYDMWLAKPSKEGYSFSASGSGKTLAYNETEHLQKLVTSNIVDSFEAPTVTSDAFGLD
jgi:hypothetical protein